MNTRILVLMLLLAPLASAGSQSAPEIVDPAGDQSETDPGPLDATLGEDHDFSDADIIGAWFDQVNLTHVNIHVETSAEIKDNTNLAIGFVVVEGNQSRFGSNPGGAYTLESTGTTITTGNGTMTKNGTVATYTVAYEDIGAVGGDVLEQFAVAASRAEPAPAATSCPAGCEAQTGTDSAPDSGFGVPYALDRIPIVASAGLKASGGEITHITYGLNGTAQGTSTTTFTGPSTTTMDVNATVRYDFVLTNKGTDVDSFNVTLDADFAAANITSDFADFSVTLDPAATHAFSMNLALSQSPLGDHVFQLQIDSALGASAVGGGVLTVDAIPIPPPVEPPVVEENVTARNPVVGEDTFLQTWAEGMKLDKAFGDYAEVALLAIALLLIIVLIFVIWALAGAGPIKVTVTPKHAVAGPGETAEFKVSVKNKKRRFHDALAYFDGDASWRTGMLLKQDQGAALAPITEPGAEREVSIGAKEEPGDSLEGTLRVQVPQDAGDGETDDITLNIVPTEGGKRLRGGHAKVRVKAAAAGAAPRARGDVPIRLSDVTHTPRDPSPGDEVTTRATLENDSETDTLRLRVVLELDGEEVEQEVVEVPPHSARAVLFPWVAEDGNNKVRVQVYLA